MRGVCISPLHGKHRQIKPLRRLTDPITHAVISSVSIEKADMKRMAAAAGSRRQRVGYSPNMPLYMKKVFTHLPHEKEAIQLLFGKGLEGL